MSTKNWDRVPFDAQSIDAPLSRAAVFLVVTVASELTALTKVCSALDGLDDLIKSVGFRDLPARLSCIVGIGRSLWDRLHFDKHPLDQAKLGHEQAVNGYTRQEREAAPANVGKALTEIKAVQPIIDQMEVCSLF